MANRYSRRTFIQPIRKISIANTDIPYVFKQFDNVDSLASKYLGDVSLGWVIMCANPQYNFEWEIKAGDNIRIPFPLERVWNEWGIKDEI